MNLSIAASALLAAAMLAGCASYPEYDEPRRAEPVNLTKVYFYPSQGQSEAQQDRDRYDCYVWAVDQTGFDPSRQIAPRDTRATVVPARSPGETIATGAAVGAVIGAVAGEGAQGAVVGAMAGTAVGAAVASAEAEGARAAQARADRRGHGRHEREAVEYRRAMSACLEGRGYSVR